MKYIVDSEIVSRDTFYFCQMAKEKNKKFVLLNSNTDLESYINNHPEFDYFIYDEMRTYYTKGEETFTEWFDKDDYFKCSWCTPEDMVKRYNRSKFKDTMTFEEWYTKNGWEHNIKTTYHKESHDIPTQEDFEEKLVKTKLFSITVTNDNTVKTINEIREKYGDFCIEYVLRNFTSTEIIYKDTYKEI